MKRTRIRLLTLITALVAFLILVTLLYHAGMARYEGKPRTLLQAIEWTADTFTTTGYGRDTHWSHPAMIALVITVQFAGMIIVPMVMALFVLPLLAERFEQRLPRAADPKLRGRDAAAATARPIDRHAGRGDRRVAGARRSRSRRERRLQPVGR
jgi:hypothetical protein